MESKESLAKRRSATQRNIQMALSSLMALSPAPTVPQVPSGIRAPSADMRYPAQGAQRAPQGASEAVFNAAIQKLIAATGGKVKVVSGKRSTQRQAQLYAEGLKKHGPKEVRKWVAPPGRSRHEKGEAADLGGDLNLAAKLASQYGLYRPLSNEPWHFELIGSRK